MKRCKIDKIDGRIKSLEEELDKLKKMRESATCEKHLEPYVNKIFQMESGELVWLKYHSELDYFYLIIVNEKINDVRIIEDEGELMHDILKKSKELSNIDFMMILRKIYLKKYFSFEVGTIFKIVSVEENNNGSISFSIIEINKRNKRVGIDTLFLTRWLLDKLIPQVECIFQGEFNNIMEKIQYLGTK